MVAHDGPPSAIRQKSKRKHYVALIGPAPALEAKPERALAVERPEAGRKVAVIVTHGMGTQVPFETLQKIAECLEHYSVPTGSRGLPVRVRLAELNGTQLPRAEMNLLGQNNQPVVVHLYEAYWAPLTEGKVTARDSAWFLFMAGLRGVRSSIGRFDRWMFGDWQDFPVRHLVLSLTFLLILAALGSLLLMNAAVTLSAAAYYSGGSKRTVSAALVSLFTQDLYAFEARLAAYLGIGLLVPMVGRWAWRHLRGPFHLWTPVQWALRGVWILTLLLTIWSGFKVAYHWLGAWSAIHGPGVVLLQIFRSIGEIATSQATVQGAFAADMRAAFRVLFGSLFASPAYVGAGQLAPNLALALLIALIVAYAVRWFLREYVGDVAAYVSSYAVSKFDELRNDIQKACLDVMRPVYEQRSENGFEYEEIVIVGHSLGTVISYDALNALINQPRTAGPPLDVPRRTKCFLTFGSPLDKTAFIFRTQRPRANEVREALAAAKQPLIQSYAFRPAKWVNIYAPDDWISGKLKFYDPSAQTGSFQAVNNIKDPEACIPGAAHTFYWTSEALTRELYQAVIS